MTFPVLGFAGQIGAGKSTISTLVADALNGPRVAFGDHVRSVARQRGIETSRESLQILGEDLVCKDCREFCRAVLMQANWQQGQLLIVDGIRHLQVLCELRRIVHPQRFLLVFINGDNSTRRIRVESRASDDSTRVNQFDGHATEVQVKDLVRQEADLVVNGSLPPVEIMREIVTWVRYQSMI
jgi:dephospho-CoA kinase